MKQTYLHASILALGLLSFGHIPSAQAQRVLQSSTRGVVAVVHNQEVFISWRKWAQDPETAQYNVYYRPSSTGSYTKLNTEPLNASNFTSSTATIQQGGQVAVALVVNGVEQSLSEPFTYQYNEFRGQFLDIRYTDSPLSTDSTTTKFVWPIDLTGDGVYDYVVDRLCTKGNLTQKIEAYTHDGQHLWTVDMGPNVNIDTGHNDMVIAYDLDCDGLGEVIIKSSDGTRFWDAEHNTWGKFLLDKEDTDQDGIIDYKLQNVRNAPQYITVIDGLKGTEKATIEIPHVSDGIDSWTRDNKANYMGDGYNDLVGHMCICYLDGVHPSISMEYCNRDIQSLHHYYNTAWGYDFSTGQAGDFIERFTFAFQKQTPVPDVFHHIRVADLDADGKDEVINGAYGLNNDGTLLMNSGICHGDRFRISDIDPSRPGLEVFAIQQNAASMLGQILYDAKTGEAIKKWYMSSVGDVGRGECMDVLPQYKGYEMWSTMPNMYTAQGDVAIEGTYKTDFSYPTEGIWWDGELDREYVNAPDSKYNADVRKFSGTGGIRLYEIAKASNYAIHCETSIRAMFWGDIIGDWREELILRRGTNESCTGIVGFTTDYATDINNIYCLMEDPAYRMQCTTKGYYQSPNTGFYLGYDMPAPPLPSSMQATYVWSNSNTSWNIGTPMTDMLRAHVTTYADGSSIIFPLDGADNIEVTSAVSPDTMFIMAPSDKVFTFSGNGSVTGNTEIWKSQAGKAIINIPLANNGKTYISEGILELNNTMSGNLSIRARGTLSGNPTLNGAVDFESALNYEGCRLMPGTDKAPFGTITFNQDLNIDQLVFMEMNLQTADAVRCDLIQVNGNVSLTDSLVLHIKPAEEKSAEGKYKLLSWTGNWTGNTDKISVMGLSGLSYTIVLEDKALYLQINGQRSASKSVTWTGAINGLWNYQTDNFSINGDVTSFVAGDVVTLNDNATTTHITFDELVPIGGVNFTNEWIDYTLSCATTGGFSGEGGLIKTGAGALNLNTNKSNYTGPTILTNGTVYVNELADGGYASPFGAASTDAGNLQLGNMTLVVNHLNTSTDRGITLLDTATIEVPKNSVAALKGMIKAAAAGSQTTLNGLTMTASGNGCLVKEGAGQLNLSCANNYKGMIVKDGILAMSTWTATFCQADSMLTAHNGTISIFDNNSTSAVPDFHYQFCVPDSTDEVSLTMGSRCKIRGTWTGNGTVNLSWPYVRGDFYPNMSNFCGTLAINGGDNTDFRITAALDMSKAHVSLGTGVTVNHYKSQSGTTQKLTTKIGSLSGTPSSVLGIGTWNIGYDNTDSEYFGTFNGNASVYKYGTGTLTLSRVSASSSTSSNNISAAAITAYNGSICISNNLTGKDYPITTGMLSAAGNGSICGSGYVKSLNITTGGTLNIGTGTSASKKIYASGNVTVNKGNLIFHRNASSNDKLIVDGNVTMTSPTIELVITRGNDWASGDSLQIIECEGTISINGDVTIVADLHTGLSFDTSRLAETGCLFVTGTDAIEKVWVDAITGEPIYYDMAGQKVENPSEGGIYLMKGKKIIYHNK